MPALDEALFRKQWPFPLVLQHLDPFEVRARGLSERKSWYRCGIFEFVSESFGSVLMPEGRISDLASIPRGVELIDAMLDADSPIMGPASQPHDHVFSPILVEGRITRGWIDPPSAARPRRLSLKDSNLLLLEAMRSRGASGLQCELVYAAVMAANISKRDEFAP